MLLRDTQVLNVDDVYGADIDSFIMQINAYLNRLLTRPMLDIRWFKVKRIDYCFNIKTDHVQTYLDFMTKAFMCVNKRSRKNYAQEKKLKGSVYGKTKSDYDQNERRNYVLNFYDKTDRLMKLKAKGMKIRDEDIEAAKNILRLEVQCGYQLVKQLCQALSIENLFGNLFDYAVAVAAEERAYYRVFGCGVEQDFYAYQAAKKLLPPRSDAARAALYSAATNHRIRGKKYAHGCSVIKKAGIYPHCFLPEGCGADRLDNPLKLILAKLESMQISV